MLLDARSLADGTALEADVCIAGGGAAGITLARDVARRTDLSVVLLESGGFNEGDSETTDLYDGHVTGEPLMAGHPLTLQEVRLRLLGGTTNHWAGWCRPMRDIEFEARPWVPYSGWPLTRDDLVPWWHQALDVIQAGPFQFEWRPWAQQLGTGPALVDNDVLDTSVYQIAYPRKFGEMYGNELKTSKNIRLVIWANLVDLPTDPSGRITRADVKTTTGKQLRVSAKVFVVALGGLETPRVLLAANGGRGVGNERDLVGRFFMEHLEVSTSVVALPWTMKKLSLYTGAPGIKRPGHPDYTVLGTMGTTDATLRRRELQAAQAVLIFPNPLADTGIVDDRGATIHDVAALAPAMGGATTKAASVVQTVSEQRPNPASRVTLARDVDALGMPRLDLDWQFQPEDRASILTTLSILATELGRAGIGRLQIGRLKASTVGSGSKRKVRLDIDPDAFDAEHFEYGIGYHHMGTTRMSTDPSQGVVDPQCRVHSSPNLYVAGSAVFPTSGASPPTFTLIALALRLGEHLRTEVLA